MACVGIVAGLSGTVLVSMFCYFTAVETIWPDVGKRVDRIFRDLEAERFRERQDGMWPTFRALAPNGIYRAVERHYAHDEGVMVVSGWVMRLPSGGRVHRQTLKDSAEPIIAMGKPAVPYLFKWVMHNDLHVRYVAIHALEEITGKNRVFMGLYWDKEDPEGHRQELIQMWQEWYEKGQ